MKRPSSVPPFHLTVRESHLLEGRGSKKSGRWDQVEKIRTVFFRLEQLHSSRGRPHRSAFHSQRYKGRSRILKKSHFNRAIVMASSAWFFFRMPDYSEVKASVTSRGVPMEGSSTA